MTTIQFTFQSESVGISLDPTMKPLTKDSIITRGFPRRAARRIVAASRLTADANTKNADVMRRYIHPKHTR